MKIMWKWRCFCSHLLVVLGIYSAISIEVRSADTIYFSTSAAGTVKSISEWGYDTAWPSYDNARLSILNFGGVNQVDTVRVNFHEFEALQADGTLGPQAKAAVDYAANLAMLAGNKPISLTPDTGAGTNAWYLDNGGGVSVDRYAAMIKATAQYLSQQYGLTVGAVEVWNEPDYWSGQPTAPQVNSIIATLKANPLFHNATMMGPSTLSPNTWWYDQISSSVSLGSTHKLGGNATDYINFIQHVQATGDKFYNPEIHSMAEMVMGAEYGMQGGIFWGPALNARGLFVQSSGGNRLGYAENRGDETAAAVYRAPDGKIRIFAGGFERQGSTTYYRAVSSDRDVYFNGVGPIREFMVKADKSTQGTCIDVLYGSDAIGLGSAFDGNRWKIVNRQTGQVLQVAGGSTANGAVVNTAADGGTLNQRWNITRSDDGYFAISNANSGITMDVFNWSLADGGLVDQWGAGDNLTQQWTMKSAGNGYFYFLGGNSGKYLTGNPTQAYQSSLNGSFSQQWQLVRVNTSTGMLKAQFNFQNNVNDSASMNHATVSGTATYVAGPNSTEGQALVFNGSNTYVTLPPGIANNKDITLSTWVKWNGGNNWQRIFDFGNDTTSYMFLTPSSGDGTMRFGITTSGAAGEQILDTDPLPTGQWVHLALTLGGNTGILFVNGAPRVAGQISLNATDFNPMLNYLGKSQYADPLFNGTIDDFRIYDYALDQAQIANLIPTSHYIWTGAANLQWSTATIASPKNWKLTFSGANIDYADGDSVLFDDSATSFTVNVATNVMPSATTFYHSNTYTLTGAAGIAGAGAVTKNGLGTLNINNINTYTGSTTINSGTVNLSGSLAGTAITVNAARFSESATGAISGGAALTNFGVTSLAGTNTFGAVHASGPGTLALLGGTTTANGNVSVSDLPGDNAVLNVTNGLFNANSSSVPSISIGSAYSAIGTMSIFGGTVNAATEVWVSSMTGTTGILNVGGGTLNCGSWLAVGRGGNNGVLNISGGNVNVNGGNLAIASFGGDVGQAIVSGGAVTTVNSIYVAEGGTGTLTVSGAGNIIINGSEGLRVGRNTGSVGTVKLNSGGAIAITAAAGGSGISTFNFNGGILRALVSNVNFFQGFSQTYIQGGGAKFDTNGFAISIAQPLLHDSALGMTLDGGLSKQGTGSLTLLGTNTYSGNTMVLGGILNVNALNTPAATVAVYNNSTLTASSLICKNLTIGGTGPVAVPEPAAIVLLGFGLAYLIVLSQRVFGRSVNRDFDNLR